jgi:hypothetical protein
LKQKKYLVYRVFFQFLNHSACLKEYTLRHCLKFTLIIYNSEAGGGNLAERTRAYLDRAHRQSMENIREQLGEDNIVYDAINASRAKMRTTRNLTAPGSISAGIC